MANQIIFPYLSPVKFTKMTPEAIPQYVSKFIDDYRFKDTIRDFEQPVCFMQKWLMDDAVRLQFISNYAPLTLKLMDENGLMVHSQVFETMQQDAFRPGYYIRQSETDVAGFDPGYYYWQIEAGSTPHIWVSEPQEFVEEYPNSLYAEYSHYERYGDVIFDAPYSPTIRIPAILKFKAPGAKDTVYEDQPMDQEMIKSVPYRLWDLIIGDAKGVPPWLIDKINWILGCSDLRFDGRYYTKNEGATLEENETDRYPMAGYKIEMRERYRKTGVEYDDDVQITGTAVAMAVIDAKGFGLNDDGGNFLEIYDIE